MKGAKLDVTGIRYGILTAIKRLNIKSDQGSTWLFKCDCGCTVPVRLKDARHGNTASCGCLQTPTKGKPRGSVGLPINRPWRPDDKVDDRWLVLTGNNVPEGTCG